MDIIDAARNVGKELQKDKRYIDFQKAMKNANDDEELQNNIKEFNLRKMSYEHLSKQDPENEKLKDEEAEVDEIYNKIISNENMIKYDKARQAMQKMMNDIFSIVNQCAGAANPETCEPQEPCSGSCEGCKGCN